jgi:hypothetical protein
VIESRATHDKAKDTSSRTDASNDQPQSRKNPITDWIQVLCSIALVLITGFLSIYARDQIEESRRAIDLAAKQFSLSERPWLSAELRVIADLSFDQYGVGSLGVEVVLHNSGKTPALNARLIQYLVADAMDIAETGRRQEALCGPLRTQEIDLGNAIFPGGSERIEDMVRIRKSDIEAAAEKNLKPWMGTEGAEEWRGKIAPSLITCIDYRSSLATKHHQTRYFSMVGPRSDPFSMQTALAPIGVHKSTQLWRFFYGQFAD